MDLDGAVAIVTGGGSGLGAAICRRLSVEGASGIVVADIAQEPARLVADEVGGVAVRADVGSEESVIELVRRTEQEFGRVDVVFSNAGIHPAADLFTSDESFELMWRIHIMSVIYLARHTLPGMLTRHKGGLVVTASTDGVTTSTGNLSYAITKHGQVAAAEWLAMVYGSRGIQVTCFCPAWMWTGMTEPYLGRDDAPDAIKMAMMTAVTAGDAAAMLLDGVKKGLFFVTTTANTRRDFLHKARDFDGWIAELGKWHDRVQPDVGRETH